MEKDNKFDHNSLSFLSENDKLTSLNSKILVTKNETREVLTEEKYVKNLEKIIVRDYFPELPKLKAQSEYVEALSKNDHAKIRELQIRYSTRRLTDRRTSPSVRPTSPSVFDSTTLSSSNTNETPYANKDGDNELYLKKKKSEDALENISLQSYLDKFTSEDNASFEELVQLHNKREKIKNAWMYEAEEIHNKSLIYRGLKYIKAADEQLMAIKDNNVEKPPSLDNWSYKARNAVLFDIDEAPLTLEEYAERENKNKKIINKKATRFDKDFSHKTKQSSLLTRATYHQSFVDSGHVDVTGKKISTVNQQTLDVVATPSPAPGVDESPFMTWGEIDGTPFRLDASDINPVTDNAPKFKIPELPVRERIAHDIVEKITHCYHAKRKQAIDQVQKITPKTPLKNSDKFLLMSPAAKRFATNKLGICIGNEKLKINTTKRTPISSRSIFSPAIYKMVKTKKEEPSTPNTPLTSTKKSVTDNLFNLPTSPTNNKMLTSTLKSNNTSKKSRLTATDFF